MIEYYRFFSKKQFAEDFIHGKLYMNSMSYFWKNGFEGQCDFAEGSVVTCKPNEMPFPDDLVKVIKGNIVSRVSAYRYCNILSFTRLVIDHKRKYTIRFDKRMSEFGTHVVRIKDFDEFQKRVLRATIKNNDYAIGGPVFYKKPSINTRLNCFCKEDKFNWQFEWRIAYLHDLESKKKDAAEKKGMNGILLGEPFTLLTEDLSDICEIYQSEVLWNDEIKKIYPDYIIYEKASNRGKLSEEESLELLAESNYGFGAKVEDENDFQRVILSIDSTVKSLFKI